MAELILIRHGRSKGNANHGIIQGSGPDPANTLDDEGEQQAARLGHRLKALNLSPAAVWVSPLIRARQTGEIALGVMGCTVPVYEDDRLREMCKGLKDLPGGMEGWARETVETPEYWERYRIDGWKLRHGSVESQGETPEEVGLRSAASMNDIADQLGPDALGLVFAHGQSIRYGIGALLGWPDIHQVNKDYLLGNCEGIRLRRDEERMWQVVGRVASPAA